MLWITQNRSVTIGIMTWLLRPPTGCRHQEDILLILHIVEIMKAKYLSQSLRWQSAHSKCKETKCTSPHSWRICKLCALYSILCSQLENSWGVKTRKQNMNRDSFAVFGPAGHLTKQWWRHGETLGRFAFNKLMSLGLSCYINAGGRLPHSGPC